MDERKEIHAQMNLVVGSYNSVKGWLEKLLRIYSPLPLAARATHQLVRATQG